MATPLRPLSTGELLDKTFSLYRQNFMLFFGIAAIPQVCLFVLTAAMTSFSSSAQQAQTVTRAAGLGVAALLTVLAYLIGAVIAGGVTQAATTFAVSSLYLDEPTSVNAAYARVQGLLGRTIYTMLEVGVRIGLGLILFIIPGIIMMCRYSLAVPAAVLERLKTKDALKRSKFLSQGSGGRVLLIYFLMLILIWGISIGFGWVLGMAIGAQALRQNLVARLIQQFMGVIIGSAVGPVMTIAFALLYYDQRVRKEAFDLEHMMSALQSPATASAARVGGTI